MAFEHLRRRFGASGRVAGLLGSSAILSLLPGPTLAQTAWQTYGTGSWFDRSNWDAGVPTSTTDATVDNGGTAQVDSGPEGATGRANLLTIGSGSMVSVINGSRLAVEAVIGEGTITLDRGLLQTPATAGGFGYITTGVVIGGGGGTIDNNNGALSISGNISGAGALVFRSTGGTDTGSADFGTSVVLTGTNSYSGGTTVRYGAQIQVGADNALGSGALQVDAGGVVDLTGFSQSVTTLTGAGKIVGTGDRNSNANTTTTDTLTVQSGVYSGTLDAGQTFISNEGGTFVAYGDIHLVKTGTGTLTLTGNNTFGIYGGSTSIEGGTIAIGSGSALGSGTVTLDGGALRAASNAGGMTIANAIILGPGGGTLDSNGNHYVEFTGPIVGGSSAGVLTLRSSVDDVTTSKGRDHDIVLSGSNSSTAGTVVTGVSNVVVNANDALGTGPLNIGTDAWVGLGSSYTQEVTSLTGGGLIYANGFRSPTGTGAATLRVQSGRYAGVLSDGSSQDGSNNYSGDLSVEKTTPGTLVLSGNSDYRGATSVLGGTLRAGSQTAFSDNSAFTVATNATLDLGGFDNNIGSLAGAGTVRNSGSTNARLRVGDDNTSTTFSGLMQDGGAPLALTKRGSGTFTLSGANTYTGTTNLRDGILVVTNSTVTGTSPATQTIVSSSIGRGRLAFYGGTLQASTGLRLANPISIEGDGVTVENSGFPLVLSGNITDGTAPGLVIFANSAGNGAATILSGANTYSGGSEVRGTVRLGATNALGSGQVIVSGTLDLAEFGQSSAALSGTGLITNSGTLAPATLQVGNGEATSAFAGTLSDGSSALRLSKVGTGTLSLSGANLYSGGTDLQGGTIAVSSGSALGTGPLAMARGTALAFAANGLDLANAIQFTQLGDPTIDTGPNDATISGAISGPGDLDKLGTGTLTLTGTNTYTGATTVQQGTLLVNGSTGNSIATVQSGARLGGFGTVGGIDVLSGASLAPGVRVPYSTIHVAGNATFEAGSTFAVNINAAGLSDAVAIAGIATINGGTAAVTGANGVYAGTTRYTILTAEGGRRGEFNGLASTANLAFLAPVLSYDPNHVYLGFTQVADIASQAKTQNQVAVAGAVQSLGPNNPLFQAVLGQSPTGAQEALKSLSGEAHASAPAVAVTGARAVRGTILDRFWNIPVDGGGDAVSALDQFGSITSPALLRCYSPDGTSQGGVTPSTYTVWGQAVGDFFRNGGDGNASTVNSALGGVSFGIDTKVDAAGVQQLACRGRGRLHQCELFGRPGRGLGEFRECLRDAVWRRPLWRARRQAWRELRRHQHDHPANGGIPEFQRSRAGQLRRRHGARLRRTRLPVRLSAGGVRSPSWAAASRTCIGIATGRRAEPPLCSASAETTDVGFTTLGFRSEVTPMKDVPLVARLMLGWEHSYGDVNPGATLAFASGSASFNSYGTPLDRNVAVAEANVVWRATPATSVSLAYTGQIGERDRANGVRGRVDYRF